MGFNIKGLALCAAVLTLGAGASGAETPPKDRAIAIMGATVFDATGASPRIANVIVRDGRIAAVGGGLRAPRGARIVDGRGKALLPGFFDVHTHWAVDTPPGAIPAIATAYVESGVTTVNDFHQPPEAFAPRRRWLAALATPHVNLTARVSTPGGHGSDWRDQNLTRLANTPESGRAVVRAIAAYEPDAIKVFADGWRYGAPANNTSMDEDALTAIVEEAHARGLKVLTHTVTADRAGAAARAGVDVIAHSVQDADLDEATIHLLRERGVAYAPTLAVYEPVKPGQAARFAPGSEAAVRAQRRFDFALRNAARLQAAGVRIALGTDAGMPGTPHGVSTLREMELLVRAGLTPTEALMAGTANSAEAMGVAADRGTIQVGKRADLVLVDGAPWETIADVHRTHAVFIDGRMVKGPGVELPQANRERTLPALRIGALIDDFERADGRTSLDTLRTDDFDEGRDRSVEVSQVVDRLGGGRALSVTARMAERNDPFIGVIFPLTRGGEQPVDIGERQGIRFDIRGDGGPYEVIVTGLDGAWTATVEAGPEWKSVEAPFVAMKPTPLRGRTTVVPWTAGNMMDVRLRATREPGRTVWFEIDNLAFY